MTVQIIWSSCSHLRVPDPPAPLALISFSQEGLSAHLFLPLGSTFSVPVPGRPLQFLAWLSFSAVRPQLCYCFWTTRNHTSSPHLEIVSFSHETCISHTSWMALSTSDSSKAPSSIGRWLTVIHMSLEVASILLFLLFLSCRKVLTFKLNIFNFFFSNSDSDVACRKMGKQKNIFLNCPEVINTINMVHFLLFFQCLFLYVHNVYIL